MLKRTDERAPLAHAAPGATPEMKLVTKSWMVGRQETTNGMESMKYVPQMTVSVWMPFKQKCDEESGDAFFDSFKTAPWDAGGTQKDRLHEVMCRTMVHNVDRWTTRNTERELATKMLMDTNCPRLTMTPGEDDASYGGTQIGGELHDTLDISDGHTRRKDDDILCRSAVCVEIDIPADMNCTAVELNNVTILRRRLLQRQDLAEHNECYISQTRKDEDILRRSPVCVEIDILADMNCTVVELIDVTILRRRLPQRQDSAEHHECYGSVSNTAVEFNDAFSRRRGLPRTEVFAEGVEEKCIAPTTDSVSAKVRWGG